MNARETAVFVRLLRAACPAQKLDEHTAELWGPALARFSMEECHQALLALTAQQNFISPADITQEIRRARDRVAERAASRALFGEGHQPRRGGPPPAEWLAAREAAGMPASVPALAVRCPWCRAAAGQGCEVPGWGKPRLPHEARWRAAGLPVPASQEAHYAGLARKASSGSTRGA